MRIIVTLALACAPAALCGQTESDTLGGATARLIADSTAITAADTIAGARADAPAFGSLHVTVDTESVAVVVDGSSRGLAPAQVDSLLPGPHIVLLIPPDPSSWLTAAGTDTVVVTAGVATTRRYTMHRWYSIASIPAGASVSTDDSLAGTTPLLLPAERLTRGTRISVGSEGFTQAAITLDDFVRGTLLVRLEPTSPADMPKILATRELLPEPPSSIGLYVSGIASVAFGVAAAYFKGSADRAADQYLVTRDPSLLARRDQMDKRAALAAVGLQVSLGFFMYFLLSR